MISLLKMPSSVINYNAPDVLDALKRQLIPKYGLENVADRIITGQNGGLAFLLMDSDSMSSLSMPIIPNQMNLAREYFDAVETYIHNAQVFSERSGFKLLTAMKDAPLETRYAIQLYNPDAAVNTACIGGVSIESHDWMDRFYGMVRDAQESSLKVEFKSVQDAVVKLKSILLAAGRK